MRLFRFLLDGRHHAESPLERPLVAAPAGEDRLWDELIESGVGRAGARLIAVTTAAASESMMVSRVTNGRRAWRALAPLSRFRLIGTGIVLAVAVHLAMMAPRQPAGFWWLILPGLAATFGIVVLGLSLVGPRRMGAGD